MSSNRHVSDVDVWAETLGLLPVPVFPEDVDRRYVMLNGPSGNFCLDLTERDADRRAVAWSADVAHYIFLSANIVEVQRWDIASTLVERYSAQSVLRRLAEFHNHLEKTQPRYERSVVPHAIRVFRLLRGSLGVEDGTPALHAFLLLLACAIDHSSRADLKLADWGLSKREYEAAIAVDNADWELLSNDLVRGRSDENLILNPKLLLRHAAGQLFQEAHYEATLIPQLSLPGFGPQPPLIRKNVSSVGVHFTPPSLARMVVEQALHLMDLKRNKIRILDPACGSGEFLRESLRQLRLRGFQGQIDLIGFDISEAACAMARFALTWERNVDTHPVEVKISHTDSLGTNKWPEDVDLIVMNPPFVSYEQLKPDQLAATNNILGPLAKGRVDMSSAFVWRATTSVKQGSIVATLIPASFLEAAATAEIRKEMQSVVAARFVARLGSQQLFRDVLVDAAALILQVGHPTSQRNAIAFWADHRVSSSVAGFRALRRATQKGVDFDLPVIGDGFSIYLAPTPSSSMTWAPRSYEAWQLLSRLQSLPTVGELFSVHTGARPGYLPAFVIDKTTWSDLPRKEQRYFRPAVVNESVAFGYLTDSKYVFYPYGRNRIANERELRTAVPTYYSQFLLPNKPKLLQRSSKRDPSIWWEMSESRTWQHKTEPKLVSVYFGKAGSFAYDEGGSFVVVQGFAWLPKRGSAIKNGFHQRLALAYLAILNSPIMNDLLAAVSNPVQGGQWDLSARFVERIALPNLLNSEGSALLDALAQLGLSISRGTEIDHTELNEAACAAYGVSTNSV